MRKIIFFAENVQKQYIYSGAVNRHKQGSGARDNSNNINFKVVTNDNSIIIVTYQYCFFLDEGSSL